MNKQLFCTSLLAVAIAAVVSAQTPPANPIASSHNKMYMMLGGVVVAAAEKMPEENYSFKPTPDVRTFGQLVGHLADSQTYFCSLAAGEKKAGDSAEKTKTTKADLVAALKDAVAYCKTVYAGMTDAQGAEMVKFMNADMAKLSVLAVNAAHDYEHYGNMVTYMRLKGIVPPTSESKPESGQDF
ncbi:MAG: DinB family protein [Acidobacteriaceae bacterium]|nr:DinB family protein [Acidobacteriaceae bacterium]